MARGAAPVPSRMCQTIARHWWSKVRLKVWHCRNFSCCFLRPVSLTADASSTRSMAERSASASCAANQRRKRATTDPASSDARQLAACKAPWIVPRHMNWTFGDKKQACGLRLGDVVDSCLRHRECRCQPSSNRCAAVWAWAAALRIGSLRYFDSRLMVLTAWFGPRQPKNLSSLFSSALVVRKNSSSSSRAREGRWLTSLRSVSSGERSGTANTRSLRSFLPSLLHL